jgi:2-haloacid dehalogenase
LRLLDRNRALRSSRARKVALMNHTAYVFDAYGTLFDVHAAVRRHAGEI